jgi:hypothetical protein
VRSPKAHVHSFKVSLGGRKSAYGVLSLFCVGAETAWVEVDRYPDLRAGAVGALAIAHDTGNGGSYKGLWRKSL